jgi:ketosteroid isomerase-like protein
MDVQGKETVRQFFQALSDRDSDAAVAFVRRRLSA